MSTFADSVVEQRALAAKRELQILSDTFLKLDGDRKGALNKDDVNKACADYGLSGDLFGDMASSDGMVSLTSWLDNMPKDAKRKICAASGAASVSETSAPNGTILYTYTDEAPMLATYSLLPILQAFTKSSGVALSTPDISVAGRILANFPDYIKPEQYVPDHLANLGEIAKTPAANIIKLPNVSAALPQLTECIAELRGQGYMVPEYPADPQNAEEEAIKARYAKVLGSAVNPVLREGNSDRRVAGPVKKYAAAHPKMLGAWKEGCQTHVAHMDDGDFFSGEVSTTIPEATTVRIEFVSASGDVKVMKQSTPMQAGEVMDASRMSVKALRAFFAREIEACKQTPGVLLSLHLKATMMKVSDPIMFGHCVEVYYKDVFEKHAATFAELDVRSSNGLGDVYAKIGKLPADKKAEIEADLQAVYKTQPPLAMVDSDKGITNLHAPNDIIIDASVPPVIRDSGGMWGPDGNLADTKMMIPDRCYATQYAAIVDDCLENGAFDVSTMGNVSNVGLMAQKAEEYGSHDKTFTAPGSGTMRVVDNNSGEVLLSHELEQGDIWRACQTKDEPIQDWIRLALSRARATGNPVVFWLNKERAHDAQILAKIDKYMPNHDTTGLDVQIMKPADAMKFTCGRVRAEKDTISATGNVLRDYLTDLFPILELGTSAKMLSIVPLLKGGGLYETGAGGSAPKHIQQLVKENHLRWDSLGEFLALAVSMEEMAAKSSSPRTKALADSLNTAIGRVLFERKSPMRKVHQLDNRGSHYYLAKFWAEALAEYPEFADEFKPLAAALCDNEAAINKELDAVQGRKVELGGYYNPDPMLAEAAMRPSPLLNSIIDSHLTSAVLSPLAC